MLRRRPPKMARKAARAVHAPMFGQPLTARNRRNLSHLMRDILETTFLLDYFHSNRDQIAVWRACDEKKRSREFGAMKIRIALDDRDGFTERKREAAYNLLCQLGTHPTYTGFQMLQAKGSNLTIVGPFFESASLDAVLSELAKTIMQAGSQARHAKERDIADYRISLDYLTTQADWSDHFFGTKMDRGKIAEIQAMVDEIERRRGAVSQAPC
jgi:hypothetical protein